MVSLIFARSLNYCIGKNGKLPWRLPADFAHFKKTTVGNAIIMGRRTFDDHGTVLKNRLNIVISRDKGRQFPEKIIKTRSLSTAIEEANNHGFEVFVIGGAGLLSSSFDVASCVYETVVDSVIEGDTFLNPMNFDGWESSLLLRKEKDEQHPYAFSVYKRKRTGLLVEG